MSRNEKKIGTQGPSIIHWGTYLRTHARTWLPILTSHFSFVYLNLKGLWLSYFKHLSGNWSRTKILSSLHLVLVLGIIRCDNERITLAIISRVFLINQPSSSSGRMLGRKYVLLYFGVKHNHTMFMSIMDLLISIHLFRVNVIVEKKNPFAFHALNIQIHVFMSCGKSNVYI